MAETSYYPPTAFPPSYGGSDTPGPVQVAIAGPTAQRRATVAVRAILAVPHLIVLDVLGIAALVVVAIGWFGALATGRLPDFAGGYLSGYLRWASRVSAYLLLLTDEYPPFAFNGNAYPVQVAVGPGRLNRFAVLFRFILGIPVAIVTVLLGFGTMIVVVFAGWPALLITGKLPQSLHQALAAVLRYNIRAGSYLYLLTDTYPAGLFGDPPGNYQAAEPPLGGPGYGTPGGSGYGTPSYGVPSYGVPEYGFDYGRPGYGAQQAGYGPSNYASPGYGASPVPGYPTPAAPPAGAYGQDARWRLVLSTAGKRLVQLILAFGLLLMAGEGFGVGVVINSAIQRDHEISQLNLEIAQHNAAVSRLNAEITREQRDFNQAHNATDGVQTANDTLDTALSASVNDTDSCSTMPCFDAAALPAAHGLTAFGRTLRGIPMPSASSAIANKLIADSNSESKGWTNMSHAATPADYENAATPAESSENKWDSDYSALLKSLGQVESTLQSQAANLDGQALTLNNNTAALVRRGAQLNVVVKVENANEA